MQVVEIKRMLEAQKTNIDASLGAINALMEHTEKQSQEIVKLNDEIKKLKEE